MSDDRDPRDDLRLSDAERLHALEALGSHYAEGRLDDSEFHARSGDVAAARTLREVEPAFVDLPGGSPLRVVDGRVVTTSPGSAGSGDLVPAADRRPAVPAGGAGDPEAELERVRRTGRIVDAIDGAAFAVAVTVFLVLQFVVHLVGAWIVFPVMFGVLAVSRAVTRFGDDDEELWEEIKEKDADERRTRLRAAHERIRELGDGREV